MSAWLGTAKVTAETASTAADTSSARVAVAGDMFLKRCAGVQVSEPRGEGPRFL